MHKCFQTVLIKFVEGAAVMVLEVSFFAAAWFLAGLVNNIVGMGAAMVAMPIVAHFMPLSMAVPSTTLIVLILNTQLVWNHRDALDYGRLFHVLLGGVIGAAAGIYLVSSVHNDHLKILMGIFLICFALYSMFFGDRIPESIDSRWGVAAGGFSAFFGAAFGLNGPPLAVYTSLSGLKGDAAKGFLGACFIISSLAILVGQFIGGLQTLKTFYCFAVGCPATLLGGWAGIRLSNRLAGRSNRKIILVIIFLAGISVLRSAL